MSSESAGISALSLSVISAVVQTSNMKGAMVPLGSPMVPNFDSTDERAHARDLGDLEKARKALYSGVRSSPLVLSRDSVSASWWSTTVRRTTSISSSDSLSHHRAILPVASVMVGSYRSASLSVQFVKLVPYKQGRKTISVHITSRNSRCVVASFCSLSFRVRDQSPTERSLPFYCA